MHPSADSARAAAELSLISRPRQAGFCLLKWVEDLEYRYGAAAESMHGFAGLEGLQRGHGQLGLEPFPKKLLLRVRFTIKHN